MSEACKMDAPPGTVCSPARPALAEARASTNTIARHAHTRPRGLPPKGSAKFRESRTLSYCGARPFRRLATMPIVAVIAMSNIPGSGTASAPPLTPSAHTSPQA